VALGRKNFYGAGSKEGGSALAEVQNDGIVLDFLKHPQS
jgi:hypothetical protein